MANNNLVLQLLITAKDNATSTIKGAFDFLDKTTSASANLIRGAFSNIFSAQGLESAANFEEAMARVNAVMRPMPADFEALREKAEQLGRDTRYTATQAAEGLEILAKAGFTANDAISALPSVLALAQGASLSLGDAAGYISDTLTQFGIGAEQSARAADTLSKAANSANMTVGDMGQALKYVGGHANQAGLSLEKTAAILDVFAQGGLRADMAGTALRDLLQDLNNPASEARESLFKLGINTNNLSEAIDGLRKAGPGGTQAIADFGVRSSGAMRLLVNAGTEGIKVFEDSITAAQGYAESSRQIMDNTLKGAVFAIQSSWEAMEIALKSPWLAPLQAAIRSVSSAMNELSASGSVKAFGEGMLTAFTPLLALTSQLGAVIGTVLTVAVVGLTQKTVALGLATKEYIATQLAAKAATAEQAAITAAQAAEEVNLARIKEAVAIATANETAATFAHTRAVLAEMEANLGNGVSAANLVAAKEANVVAAHASIAANAKAAAATQVLTTAELEAAAAANALTASSITLSRVMSVVMGPAGLILAGVAAFALLYKSADNQKIATDALAKSTDAYAESLKKQTLAQNEVTIAGLNTALDEQRKNVEALTLQWEAANRVVQEGGVTYSDTGEEIITTSEQVTAARAKLDEATTRLKGTEERLGIAQKQVAKQQEDALPGMAERNAKLGVYQEAVEKAAAAEEKAAEAVRNSIPGTQARVDAENALVVASGKTFTANEELAKAEGRLDRARLDAQKGLTANTEALAGQIQVNTLLGTAQEAMGKKVVEANLALKQATIESTNAAAAGMAAKNATELKNKAYQKSKNALDQLLSTINNQVEAEKRHVASAAASVTTLEAQAVVTGRYSATMTKLAKQQGTALEIQEALQKQHEQAVMDSEAIAAAKDKEAIAQQNLADQLTLKYNADLLNQALSTTELTKSKEIAEAAQDLAEKKRAVAQSSQDIADNTKQEIVSIEGVVTAGEKQLASRGDLLRASLALAQAKGEEYKASRLVAEIAQNEADLSSLLASRKQVEAQAAADAYLEREREAGAILETGQALTDEQRQRIEGARIAAESAAIAAEAAGQTAQAEQKKAEAIKLANLGTSQSTDATNKNTESTQQNSEAQKVNIKHTKDTGQAAAGVANYLKQARAETEKLSAATKALFEVELAMALKRSGFEGAHQAAIKAQVAYTAGTTASSQALAEYSTELKNANALIDQSEEKLLFAANGFRKWEASIELATGKAKKAFYEQAIAAEELQARVELMGRNGAQGVAILADATRRLNNDFTLLDEKTLSGLRSEIQAATDDLREMQAEAQSAQDRIAELNAEIAAEKGDTATADRLKLQLEQQQAIAEAEAAIEKARIENNRELTGLYEEQKRKLEELYALKERNLEQDIRQRERENTTNTRNQNASGGNSASGNGGSGGKTVDLNLSFGGQTLNTTTAQDPSAFIAAIERARLSAS